MVDADVVTRQVFWNVGNISLFYVLSALSIAVFTFGFYTHVRLWYSGWKTTGSSGLVEGARLAIINGLGNKKVFQGDRLGGVIHLSIMWGFIVLLVGTILLTVHHDIYPFLLGPTYLI